MVTAAETDWDALCDRYDDGSSLVAVVDLELRLRAASPGAPARFGLEDDYRGMNAAELIHPGDLERALGVFGEVRELEGLRPPAVYRIRTGPGVFTPFDVTGENVEDLGGAVIFRLRTIDDRRRAEMLAVEQVEVFQLLGSGGSSDDCLRLLANMAERHIDRSSAVVHVAGPDSRLHPVFTTETPKEIGHRWLLTPVDKPSGNLAEARRRGLSFVELDIEKPEHWQSAASEVIDGQWRSCVTTPVNDPTGALVGYVEVLRQSPERPDNAELSVHVLVAQLVGLVVDRFSFEAALTRAALEDTLTGLGNRRKLNQTIRQLEEDRTPFSIVAVDLDQFTWINNNLGHSAGDRLLAAVAERFAAVIPPDAVAFRPGGDEFVIIVPGERRAESLVEIGRAMLGALEAPVEIGALQRQIRASIGVAAGEHGTDPTRTLGRADAAMYAAKRDGGSGVRLFTPALGEVVVRRLSLADLLRTAIADDQLRLAYQPIIELQQFEIVGVEALVRWDHPLYGLLRPDEFVPLAEETELILELDEWVLHKGIQQLATWQSRPRPGRELEGWINVSARSLDRADFMSVVDDLLRATDVAGLGVELTERDNFVNFDHAVDTFRSLRQAGIGVNIDDFGTGRASLQRLAEFDVSGLKIDRRFVGGMMQSSRYRLMVQTIVDLGTRLGLTITAEGIETGPQLDRLTELGCERGQGYLISRPLLPDALEGRFGRDLERRWTSPTEDADRLDV